MHLCLPDDRHNVTKHVRLQAFLSEQRFPSFPVPCSSALNLLFFMTCSSSNSRTSLGLLKSFTQPRCLWSSSNIFSASRSFLRVWLFSSLELQLVSSHKRCPSSYKLVRISSNALLVCVIILLNFSINIMSMFVN